VICVLCDHDGRHPVASAVEASNAPRVPLPERASTILSSNRPVDDLGKLLSNTAAVTYLLDRLLRHAHIFPCCPRR